MKRSYWLTYLGVALCSSTALAAGTAVNGVSARAQSMQNAYGAIADDASAVYYNPAGLTQINGTQAEFSLMVVMPDMNYEDANTGVTYDSTKVAFAPNLFVATSLAKPVTLALGIYSPFARVTDYGTVNTLLGPPPAVAAKHSSTIMRLDFVPTIAYELIKDLSIGAGFVASYVALDANILGNKESAKGYGFTGQAGILYKALADNMLNLGVTYRGLMSATISGDGEASGFPIGDFKNAKLHFPGVLTASIASEVCRNLMIAVQADWEMWSYVKDIKRTYPAPVGTVTTTLNSKDAGTFRVGARYKAWETSEFRLGYTYAMHAIPSANLTPAIPDYDAHAGSVGYSYSRWGFRGDLGYEFAYLPKRTGTNAPFAGEFSTIAHTVMVGLAYLY
jgi:long-chain fatty acid transport protein